MFLSSSYAICGLYRLNTMVWFLPSYCGVFFVYGDLNGKTDLIEKKIKSNHEFRYVKELDSCNFF